MSGFIEPTIGKFYKVPCVKASDTPPRFARAGGWIPVLLPEHDDKEIIGFEYRHFHLDFRFLSDRQFAAAWRFNTFGTILQRERRDDPEKVFYLGEPELRYRKCKRPMPHDYPMTRFTRPLEAKYKDAKLSNGRCPHWGLDLRGCPVTGGIVTCPGHGLRWNVETCELVPAH